ncbi:hypothetical protein L916_16547 [Plasmopara halstedii]|uniref:Uncharacterized protein n=1 Tax=Plasmopara halstedii TaxID=4781 RepID=A0A0P1AKN1_PLAHL|nr:hypothetical protein L916_16547 [Plasmopara halstedii]CEG41130.1 hypothetical protein L916_16547 [Plasmopara halstedii]|eukprot:XP_024577499.1 hypothetical protein L916_16547 [Plasmopara halstedii]
MSDPLTAPFAELCGALHGLQEQVERLAYVHEAVDDFNLAFGAFQGAMALHASCLTYPKNSPMPMAPTTRSQPKDNNLAASGTGINPLDNLQVCSAGNKKQDGTSKGKKSRVASNGELVQKKPLAKVISMKRQAKVDSNNSRIKKRKLATKAAPPVWTWERHIREKIPRKYQSPAELKKLENIVLYLKNRHCAISISDLVNHSGLPVIRCKEILQTLMKLDLIDRKREKAGFLYSFGSTK